jgi:hypothetical protein
MIRTPESNSLDWGLWFYWIMATTIGWLAGGLFSSAIPFVVSGVGVAVMQWLVLIGRIKKPWRWAVYSSAAWIVGYILFILSIPKEMGLLLAPLLGATLGIVQWLILKQELDWAGWWIPISLLAWTTGLVLLPGLLTSGALPGALTGLALVILFQYSSPKVNA